MSDGANRVGTEHPPRMARGIRRPGALIIDVALIVALVALLPQTFELSDAARRFPLITIVVMLALLFLDAAIEVFPAVRRRTGFLEADFIDVHQDELMAEHDDVEVDAQERKEAQSATHGRRGPLRVLTLWQAVAWLLSLGLGMYFLGYVASTPIFLGLFFLWARVPIKVAVGVTATMSLLNYFAFYEYLGLR